MLNVYQSHWLTGLKLAACGWYYGLVWFLIKLHEDNSQLSQLLKQAHFIDIETMGELDPSQTSYTISQNQFLAFAVLSLDNKSKASYAASAAWMCKLFTGSAAAVVLCSIIPKPWKISGFTEPVIHKSLKAIKLYIVPALSNHICCVKQ